MLLSCTCTQLEPEEARRYANEYPVTGYPFGEAASQVQVIDDTPVALAVGFPFAMEGAAGSVVTVKGALHAPIPYAFVARTLKLTCEQRARANS